MNGIPTQERMSVSGKIGEFKRAVRNGTEIGQFTGHLATWEPDEEPGRMGVPDQFMKGAFTASIQEHKNRNHRQIRMQAGHQFGVTGTIGGFPISEVHEDGIGLRVLGEINIEAGSMGHHIYSLMRQEVITDLSIGVIVEDDNVTPTVRQILRADIIEGSPVDHPMNRGSVITDVKNSAFGNLPVHMPEGYIWNEGEARQRLDGLVTEQKKQAFLWYKDDTQCALPIADVIEGKLCVVPLAVQAAATALKGHLMDGDVPREDVGSVIRTAERYMAKIGMASPFEVEEKQYWGVRDVTDMDSAEFEKMLHATGQFSNGAAKTLSRRVGQFDTGGEERKALAKMNAELKAVADGLKNLRK